MKTYDINLSNTDILPTKAKDRTWQAHNYFFLWISMIVTVVSYMIGSSFISQGFNWWQALLLIGTGNLIVFIIVLLIGYIGYKHGISLPIILRTTFGVNGARIVGLLRAFVALGWLAIQTWVMGTSLFEIVTVIVPRAKTVQFQIFGQNGITFICFLIIIFIYAVIMSYGITAVKKFQKYAALILIVVLLALLYWAWSTVGSFSLVLSYSEQLKSGHIDYFILASLLVAAVADWAPVALSIPDFTRYSKSKKSYVIGQFIGLPIGMMFVSFVGIFVTCATVKIYGHPIWNPIELLGHFQNPFVVIVANVGILIALLSCDIGSNIIPIANDLANLVPRWLSINKAGAYGCIICIFFMPWKLISTPGNFIFLWLLSYSPIIGGLAGIVIADYFIVRKMKIKEDDLFIYNAPISTALSIWHFASD